MLFKILKIDKSKDSRIFYWMRTFALLAVVMSHANYILPKSEFVKQLLSSFLISGCAVFLFAGGAYWKRRTVKQTLLSVIKILPCWFIFGSLIYSISAIKTGFSIVNWVYYLVGKNTYLWYLTIYVIIQFLFCLKFMGNKASLLMCIIVTFISRIVVTCYGISGYEAFLNPLNWIGFFALGIYIRQYNQTDKISISERIGLVVVVIISINIFALLNVNFNSIRFDYWTYFGPFMQCAWIIIIYHLSVILSNLHGFEIGKSSLVIYLLHMPFIGFVTNRLKLNCFFAFLISILVILLIFVITFLFNKIILYLTENLKV